MLEKSIMNVHSGVSIQPKSQYMIAQAARCSNSTAGTALQILKKRGLVIEEPVTNPRTRVTVIGWRKAVKPVEKKVQGVVNHDR